MVGLQPRDQIITNPNDINYPTLEEQNPELYKQYLKALRDYKAGEHKVVLVSMDNTTSAPAQRNEHLTTMPDSVDIICLMNPDNLHRQGTREGHPGDLQHRL